MQDELANAMQPMFHSSYGRPMRPVQLPRGVVLPGMEEDDASPDEEDEDEDAPTHLLHGGRVDPALLAELEASIHDTHNYRESQRRRLQ